MGTGPAHGQGRAGLDRRPENHQVGWVFGLSTGQVRLFLRHLWATDGSVRWDERAGQCRLYYASTSRRLIDDVARLLLRCNVMTRIKKVRKKGYRDGWRLHIYGAEQQLRLIDEIGVNGAHGVAAIDCAERLRGTAGNTNLDTVPKEVWTRVRGVLQERQTTHRESASAMGTAFCRSTLSKHAPSRERLGRVSALLDDASLDILATNDIFWDAVAEITPLGAQEIYDATVLGTHNFVANGVSVHNSLEQDADLVLLIHREDFYEPESPRAGEADLLVVKHRNGPTGTVTVAFQGHYSRFVDMAR